MAQRSVLAPDPRAASIPAVFLKGFSHHPVIFRKRLARTEDVRPRPSGGSLLRQPSAHWLRTYTILAARSSSVCCGISAIFPPCSVGPELAAAVSLRRDTLRLESQGDALRVIHAQSDGFPGLVVDRFGDVISAEAFSLGMYQRSEALMRRLAPMVGAKHWMVRTSS